MYRNLINLICITKESKKNFVILIFLLIISSLLEVVGLGLIIPLITTIVDHETINSIPIAKLFLQLIYKMNFLEYLELNLTKKEELIILVSSFVMVFYALKYVFLFFATWFQQAYLVSFNTLVSDKIVSRYVLANYDFHVNKSSSEMISTITEEQTEANSAVFYFCLLLTETLLLLGIIILLSFVMNLWTFYGGAIILLFSYAIKKLGEKKLQLLGLNRQIYFKGRLEALNNIFGSIKEIKIMHKTKFFLDKFSLNNFLLNKTSILKSLLGLLPRLSLEFFGIMVILSLTIIWVVNDVPSEKILYLLGLLAISAFRIIPAVSKIVTANQQLHFKKLAVQNVINTLNRNVNNEQQIANKKIIFNSKINLVIKEFSHSKKNPFKISGINLTIEKNNFIGIVGESGSGKSTIVDILLGIYELGDQHSFVKVDNNKIDPQTQVWQEKFGYIGQNCYLINDTIVKNIAFGLEESEIEIEKVLIALKRAELYDYVQSLNDKENSLISENGLNLSGGQRQRLGLARLFYRDPEILIFDEPTSSLDNETEKDILCSIDKLKGKKTIIMISHNLDNLKNADYIFKIFDGKLKE